MNNALVTFESRLRSPFVGSACTAAEIIVAFPRAQSGNVAISGYTINPHVGKNAQTVNNVMIDGPIPAIAYIKYTQNEKKRNK